MKMENKPEAKIKPWGITLKIFRKLALTLSCMNYDNLSQYFLSIFIHL